MNLRRLLPFAAFSFVIASAASMGIPGFSGFAAEITILLGVWKAYPIAVLITGAGMVLVAAFTLRALKQTFFSDSATDVQIQQGTVPVDPDWDETIPNLRGGKMGRRAADVRHDRRRPLPEVLLDRIQPAVEAMRFLKP